MHHEATAEPLAEYPDVADGTSTFRGGQMLKGGLIQPSDSPRPCASLRLRSMRS